MALDQYNFDAGPQDTPTSNANTGSSANSLTNSSTATLDSAMAAHGPFGIKYDVKAAGQAYRQWRKLSSTPARQIAVSFVYKWPTANPGNSISIFTATNAVDNVYIRLSINTSGELIAQDNGSTHQATVATGLTWGTKYRISIVADNLGGTTAGILKIKVYAPSTVGGVTSWTTVVGAGLDVSDWNMQTGQFLRYNVGVVVNSAAPVIVGLDDLQIDDDRTTEIPDFAIPNAPPVVTAGPKQSVAAGSTVTLAFTATDAEGPVASRTTTYDYPASGGPTISNGATDAPTFTAGAAGSRYIVRHTATDSGGVSSSATTEVVVPLSGSATARPEPRDGTGSTGWTIAGGSATQGAALADESNTTYVESPELSAVETARRWPWQPQSPRSASTIPLTLGVSEGTGVGTVRLYEGNTLRQSWTVNLTATPTQTVFELSPTTIAAIGDWTDLYLEYGVVAS